MFQTFETAFSGEAGPERLSKLRIQMAAVGVDGFLVPRADAHQGEYVAACDERLAWLTGFTGSAGFCAVLADQAGLFVDGRYRLQVREQAADVFTPVDWPEVKLGDWLEDHAEGRTIGFDPWLHTISEIKSLRDQANMVACPNLVDQIWVDRPAPPAAPFFVQPDTLAGESHDDKRARLAKGLRDNGQAAAVLTLPDSIAWLLNIRGADIPRNPVPQCFAILYADGRVDLFARAGKTDAIMDHLGAEVTVHGEDAFVPTLRSLDGAVLVDPTTCPQIIGETLANPVEGRDPCVLPKACKNPTEIAGARTAHLRDAVAMCRFLHWLDGAGYVTEIDVVTKLEHFRAETGALRDISFDTIAGSGPNGAIIHYRVTHDTNRQLQDGDLLVLDSGGQYQDGTTDITLCVHEGPQRLSRVSDIPLRPGMVLSNEPGYYRAKAFGIRIENLIVVQPAPPIAGGDAHRNHLSFETLTWVPLDRRLIDLTLLSRDEVSWIDSYHATVLDKVGANLDAAAKHWLEQACAPL
ncbi:MAG: M24 family metallopeptidase [Marivivens sp.]|nr:M24 family metallopeptidase [Marivivens sp.]